MKKRNFLKLVTLLPLATFAKKSQPLKQLRNCKKGQSLHFKASQKSSHLEITLIKGEVEISHTHLCQGEQLTLPIYKIDLKVIKNARFFIKEISA